MALGLVSQLTVAYYFGTSRQLDLYFIANALPAAITGMTLPLFTGSIIPQLSPIRNNPQFTTLVSKLLSVVMAMSVLLCVLGYFAGPILLSVTSQLSGQDVKTGGNLARLIWATVACEVLINYLISLLHIERRFILPALLLMFPTVGSILGMLIWARGHGIYGLLTGWLIADVCSVTILFFAARKLHRLRIYSFWKSLDASYLLKNSLAVAVGIFPFTVLPILDGYWSSVLPDGSMAYIGYSNRITQAMALVVSGGVYTAILPYLSDAQDQGDTFAKSLRNSVRAVLLFLVPMCCFAYGFGDKILQLLLHRGQFDASSQQGVLRLLPFYLCGILFMAPASLITRGYMARRYWNRLGLISVVEIVAYFAMSGILIRFTSYSGIGLAYVLYWSSFFVISCRMLDRGILTRELLVFAGKLTAASAFCVAIARLLTGFLTPNITVSLVAGWLTASLLFWLVNKSAIRLKEIEIAQGIVLGYLNRAARRVIS